MSRPDGNHVEQSTDEMRKSLGICAATLDEAIAYFAGREESFGQAIADIGGLIRSARSALDPIDSPELSVSGCARRASCAMEPLRGALERLQSWEHDLEPIGPALNRLESCSQETSSVLSVARVAGQASDAVSRLAAAVEDLKRWHDEAIAIAGASGQLARALALLYPVSKAVEKPSRIVERPERAAKQAAFAERRAAPRLPIVAEIGFQSETNFFVGFTEDISTGGIFIATYDTREIGSPLHVSFTLPNGHLISAAGTVRWTREFNALTPDTMPGMGVQFDGLKPEDHEAISGFVAQRQPLFFEA